MTSFRRLWRNYKSISLCVFEKCVCNACIWRLQCFLMCSVILPYVEFATKRAYRSCWLSNFYLLTECSPHYNLPCLTVGLRHVLFGYGYPGYGPDIEPERRTRAGQIHLLWQDRNSHPELHGVQNVLRRRREIRVTLYCTVCGYSLFGTDAYDFPAAGVVRSEGCNPNSNVVEQGSGTFLAKRAMKPTYF